MAVFMINICKFNGCGITFPRLADLIEHIEDVHIDYDPAVVEQKEASQPACIPLSYVLKFFTEASRREIQNMPPAADVRRRLLSAPKTPSVRSSTPTGSEVDEDELMSPSEDSNDSWTTVEEYSSEFILRYGVKMNANASTGALGAAAQEKPFACPVPGCKKRYKNVNGIKYHSKNGHKKDGKVKKAYKCQCGKSYKTAQGLKSHSISQHIATLPGDVRANAPKMPNLVVTASPASRPPPPPIDAIDASKLVRIYDTIKTKDLPSFTIPKHNLTHLNIINATQNGQGLRHSVILTSTSSPIDKIKFERSPKVTVTQEATYDVSSLSQASDRRG
ncbi:unnamed protein product, partial [Brenthis ino]